MVSDDLISTRKAWQWMWVYRHLSRMICTRHCLWWKTSQFNSMFCQLNLSARWRDGTIPPVSCLSPSHRVFCPLPSSACRTMPMSRVRRHVNFLENAMS